MTRTTSRFLTLLAGLCCGAVLTGAVFASITLGRQLVAPEPARPVVALPAPQTVPTLPITGLADLPPADSLPPAPDLPLDGWQKERPTPIAPPYDAGFSGLGPQPGGLGGFPSGGLGGPQPPLFGGDPLAGGGLPLGAPSGIDTGFPAVIPGDGFSTTTTAGQLRREAERTASALLRAPQNPGGFAAPIQLQRNDAKLQWQIEELKRAKRRQDQER